MSEGEGERGGEGRTRTGGHGGRRRGGEETEVLIESRYREIVLLTRSYSE